MIFHLLNLVIYRVYFFFFLFSPSFPFLSVAPPSLISEEGSYSYKKTKCQIPWVTGLVHLIKLLTCREQFFWIRQDKAVATVNSLLGGEKLRHVTPRSNVLWPRVDDPVNRVYVDWSLVRGNLLRGWTTFGDPAFTWRPVAWRVFKKFLLCSVESPGV